MGHEETRVRAARRSDAAAFADLRVAYLAEMARLEPRLTLLADVRERTEHALPVWVDQDNRLLLVAEDPISEPGSGPLLGYATGIAAIWPPVFREQHVGEVLELYVRPEARGRKIGRELLARLTKGLQELGATVLRAPVAASSQDNLARFHALGYRPLQYVLQRDLEEA